jgi:hypothetical protein
MQTTSHSYITYIPMPLVKPALAVMNSNNIMD